jgi:hypothetical protein
MTTSALANYSHQQHLFAPDTARKTVVFGGGSVGGYVVAYLAAMGAKDIEVWDADTVASHNVPMSVYRPKDVGRPKVEALREIVLEKSNVEIRIRPEMYEGQEPLRNVSVVSCVDTFAARKSIWKQVRMNPTIHLFCDTRVAEYYLEVFAIAPCERQDIKRYEMLLRDDKDAKRQTCGMHGTVLVASRAANIAAQNLTSFWQTSRKEWRVAERCDTLARVY